MPVGALKYSVTPATHSHRMIVLAAVAVIHACAASDAHQAYHAADAAVGRGFMTAQRRARVREDEERCCQEHHVSVERAKCKIRWGRCESSALDRGRPAPKRRGRAPRHSAILRALSLYSGNAHATMHVSHRESVTVAQDAFLQICHFFQMRYFNRNVERRENGLLGLATERMVFSTFPEVFPSMTKFDFRP